MAADIQFNWKNILKAGVFLLALIILVIFYLASGNINDTSEENENQKGIVNLVPLHRKAGSRQTR